MFKISDHNDQEISLRHVPEGHQYTFPVIISSTGYVLGLGEMAENPHARSAAYRFATQARSFALEIVRDEWWLELPPLALPPDNPSKSSSCDQESPSAQQLAATEKSTSLLGFLFGWRWISS